MIGWIIGIVGGIGELYLLYKLIPYITGKGQKSVLPLVLAKLVLLAGILIAMAVFAPSQLLYATTGMVGVLIGGAIVLFLKNRKGS